LAPIETGTLADIRTRAALKPLDRREALSLLHSDAIFTGVAHNIEGSVSTGDPLSCDDIKGLLDAVVTVGAELKHRDLVHIARTVWWIVYLEHPNSAPTDAAFFFKDAWNSLNIPLPVPEQKSDELSTIYPPLVWLEALEVLFYAKFHERQTFDPEACEHFRLFRAAIAEWVRDGLVLELSGQTVSGPPEVSFAYLYAQRALNLMRLAANICDERSGGHSPLLRGLSFEAM
jgi:hypothetical protein